MKTSNETVVSSSDFKSVLAYVTGTFEPDIKVALDAPVKRKADFAKVNLSFSVKSQLSTPRTKSDQFADALIKFASSNQQTAA
ncbi:MAG: hypothetical protein MMC23_004292 [Stictis urceolatum]|nr:hypothetical protein [Stictis urceolata]